jgi:hypothetical protein
MRLIHDRPRLHPLFVRFLEPVLAAAEGASAARVALPANGESGVSLGPLQLDLAWQPALRADLARLAHARLLGADASGLFAKRVRAMTPAERAQAAQLAEALLARPAGAAWLARHERAMLVRVGLAVRRVLAACAPGAFGFASALRGQIEIACHLHQFGPERTDRLEAFLAGREVAFDGADGRRRLAGWRGALDVERFRDFRRATRWGSSHPRACESRHLRVDAAWRRLGIA